MYRTLRTLSSSQKKQCFEIEENSNSNTREILRKEGINLTLIWQILKENEFISLLSSESAKVNFGSNYVRRLLFCSEIQRRKYNKNINIIKHILFTDEII